ncbi:MAG: alanine racemase [Betaproteobacteria bacterium]|nr:alanine racemase [Betaproteobacteria bacterium]
MPTNERVFGYSPVNSSPCCRPIRARLDFSALRHNFSVARAYAKETKLWAVIKADAYGHGQFAAARALDGLTDGYALLESEVAVALRERGHRQPILLLEGFFAPEEVARIVQYDLTPVIHSRNQLEMLAAAHSRPAHVYLKIDTGMNRLGFASQDTDAVRQQLERLGICQITLMTHFADADSREGFAAQLEEARQLVDRANLPWSFANSAALMKHPESLGGWARPGIMLYGGSPFGATPGHTAAELGLRPVMTLESRLVAMRTVGAGERVGYGGTWQAKTDTPVGVVACGYADGYPRHAPTGAPIAVAGVLVRTLGRVSMDMIACDLRDVPEAKVGSPVTLWGSGEGGAVDADVLAEAAGTISYELFCALAARVPRIYENL